MPLLTTCVLTAKLNLSAHNHRGLIESRRSRDRPPHPFVVLRGSPLQGTHPALRLAQRFAQPPSPALTLLLPFETQGTLEVRQARAEVSLALLNLSQEGLPSRRARHQRTQRAQSEALALARRACAQAWRQRCTPAWLKTTARIRAERLRGAPRDMQQNF